MAIMTAIGVMLGMMLLAVLLGTVPLMIGLGILHEHFEAVPALGLFESFWVLWAWGVFWNRVKFSSE